MDPTPTGTAIAEQVRSVRRRLGLTQAELAARLGLDAGTVADLEAGRRSPSARVRSAVVHVLEDAQPDPGGPKILTEE